MGEVHTNLAIPAKVNPKPPTSEEARNYIEEVKQQYAEGMKMAALRAGMGEWGSVPVTQQPTKAEEKFGITMDIAKILESQSTMTNTMFTQITDLMKSNMAAQQNTQLQQVQQGLQDLQKTLQSPAPDLFQSFLDNQEKFKKLMDLMKDTAAVPSGIPLNAASATDFSTVIQLTKLNMAQQEAQRRWEEEKLERQHKFEVDKARWDNEFKLKLIELKDSRERKDDAKDLFGAVAAAFMAGLDGKNAVQAPQEQVSLKPVRVPKTFTCQECGETVKVESPEATGAVCGKCQAEYSFAEQ